MIIDTDDYLTREQAAAAAGCSMSSLYRAIRRAEKETGKKIGTEVFGVTIYHRDALEVIKHHFFPYYSDRHQELVKTWGARGGAAKARNRRRSSVSGKRGGKDADSTIHPDQPASG